jgi:hypothetical protein
MDGSSTASVWNEVAETNKLITEAATVFDRDAVGGTVAQNDLSSRDDPIRMRETLLMLAAASEKLARLLDALAGVYDAPDMPEPPPMHVALDQAAAAAEDLGICAKVAIEAIDGDQ